MNTLVHSHTHVRDHQGHHELGGFLDDFPSVMGVNLMWDARSVSPSGIISRTIIGLRGGLFSSLCSEELTQNHKNETPMPEKERCLFWSIL